MSRRPGVGAGWFEKFKRDVFPADECVVEGRKVPVPDYYWRRLEVENPEMFAQVKEKRLERAYAAGAAPLGVDVRGAGELSPARLEVREEIARRRQAQRSQEL